MPEYKQKKWDLSDVLETTEGPKFDSFLADLNKKVSEFEALRANLVHPSKEDVAGAVRLEEDITASAMRLISYAQMRFTENTSSQEAKAFLDKAEDIMTEVQNKRLFFDLWWLGLDEKTASDLLPENADHRFYLTEMRKLTSHTLDEKVEQAINLKNITSESAWSDLYDQVTNSFSYVLRIDGKTEKDGKGKSKKFTEGELSSLVQSADPKKRRAAYHALLSKNAENGDLLGAIYANVVRDWSNENLKLRNYSSPISSRNMENGISDSGIDALLSSCRKNVDAFQDFFKVKAKLLGVHKLSRYDIYAPTTKADKKFGYSEGVNLVLEVFQEFDPKFSELARKMFDSDHVDSEIRPGKQSGAYNMNVGPNVVPFIKINYNGTIRDVFTVAHESGHGINALLASSHSILTQDPGLPMAETASILGEMVLSEKLMDRENDNKMKTELLVDRLGDLYATIQRQAYFVLFEKSAHEAIAKGATTKKLCELYMSNLKEQFGDSLSEIPDEFKWEWSRIPHIYHTPFYCYAYSFGGLLTLSLYKKYKEEGESFKPKILNILAAGGSESPEKILKETGIDINSQEFWDGGFDIVRGLVDKLKSLN